MDYGSLGRITERAKNNWAENGRNQLKWTSTSAIFIEVICHSLLHSLGNKLRLAEVLIFTFLMVKYNFYFVSR
jgi:hypothetical protein